MTRCLLAMILGLGLVAARAAAAAAPPDTHGAGDHAPAPLLPGNVQEAKEHFLTPAIWTIVIFVILLAILYPTAWKSVLAGLKAREQRIRQDIAEAEAARKRAEETLREYNARLAAAEQSVRELIAKATADGERVATTIRMQAQQEAEQIKDRATRDIEAARDAAVRQVREEAVLLATSMAEKILRRNLNPDDQRELVRGSLEELQTIAK